MLVDWCARVYEDKGIEVDFVNNEKLRESGFVLEGKQVNGVVAEDGSIKLNIESNKMLESVVGHEVTHVFEGTEMYDALAEIAVNYAKTKGEYDTRLEALNKLYEGVYKGSHFNDKVQKELVADLVGDYLFTDSKFINTLCTDKPKLFRKILDEIEYLCKVATAGSKEARELEKLKKAFKDVWRESGKAQKNTTGNGSEKKYSIVESFTDNNGNYYDSAVLLDANTFDGETPKNWWRVLKQHIEKRVANSTFIMPVVDENGQSQMLEFAKKSDWVSKNDNNPHAALSELYGTTDNISKLSAIHIDEIVEVSEEGVPYSSLPDGHGWLDANGWLHRTANVINVKNGNIYQITMDIAKTDDGRFVLYALNGKTKKVGNADVNSLVIKSTSGSEQNSNFGNILPQNSEKSSDTDHFSPSDSDILTNEQSHKVKQLAIINEYHPKADWDYQTWITSVDDIKTYAETVEDESNYATTPDFTDEDVAKALETGIITVYSSHDIRNGTFVTPSYMEAKNYAGQGKVNSKVVNLTDVAWIDSLQGQYAPVENAKLNEVGFDYDAKSRTVSYSLSSLEDAFNYKTDENGLLLTEDDYLKARSEYVDALAKSIAAEKGKPTREEYKKADRYLDSLFLVHDMIAGDRERLDYEAAVNRSAWVGNVEYGGSIDFSTLCAKRRLFTGTFDAIQNALPDTVLTDKDFLNIRKLLLEHGDLKLNRLTRANKSKREAVRE